jgi:paraquat-inducible protein A
MAKVLAYSVSAGIFLLIANSFSFLTLTAKGLKSAMTLPETALALYRYGLPELAVLVAAFIILIPALILLMLIAISLPLSLNRPARWLKPAARAFYTLHEWSMVEVFLIGVVVSLIKLSHMAEVELGFSFWAYTAFSVCFTLALTTIDRYQCWRKIEEVQAHG